MFNLKISNRWKASLFFSSTALFPSRHGQHWFMPPNFFFLLKFFRHFYAIWVTKEMELKVSPDLNEKRWRITAFAYTPPGKEGQEQEFLQSFKIAPKMPFEISMLKTLFQLKDLNKTRRIKEYYRSGRSAKRRGENGAAKKSREKVVYSYLYYDVWQRIRVLFPSTCGILYASSILLLLLVI